MSKEWKPGDVARVNGSVAVRTDDNMSWWTTSGRLSDPNVAYIRPLVVIDPEDREQVERLRLLFAATVGVNRTDALQAALREFANPTPPKPDEPRGLGAVVEDIEGVRWVSWRSGLAQHDRPWQRLEMDTDEFRDYRDITAVAVLFDGRDQ